MGSLSFKDSKFIFEDQSGEKILLDCGNYILNNSRVSMHRANGAEYLTIPNLMLELFEAEKQRGRELEFPALLIDILLASCLIKNPFPVNILEYGSGQGDFSYHLAEVSGAFNSNSSLVCAYDTIEPEWMERVSQAGRLPKLSFFAGDFGRLQLQEKYFDIIFINGTVNYIHPQEVLEDAFRLIRDDGILLCYSDVSPLLESTFKLYFEKREEYATPSFQKIFIANVQDRSWERNTKPDFIGSNLEKKVETDLERTEHLLSGSTFLGNELPDMINCLSQDIHMAMASDRPDLKIKLLEKKEACYLQLL